VIEMALVNKSRRRPEHSSTARQRRRRGGEHRAQPPRAEAVAATDLAAAGADAEPGRRLEEVVLTTWAALLAGHPVECPVCGGPLTAARGCGRCGSRLS
jgi:hypothetical protein